MPAVNDTETKSEAELRAQAGTATLHVMPGPKTHASAELDHRSRAERSNRSRLLHAASDAFAQFGFEGASLRSIADEAGASFQLITYYFGSKEELWTATVDYLFDRWLETGRGLGFTPTANLHEQFHNHLRLLMLDQIQRPQLRRICVQEFLANSARYEKYIVPRITQFQETLGQPYYRDVVRLGIVKRYSPEEVALIFSSVVVNNLVSPLYVQLLFGLPIGTPKSIEMQVDLVYEILVADPEATHEDAAHPGARKHTADDSRGIVYAMENARELTADGNHIKQLELENTRLKQLVGDLSLEKQLLLDRITLLDRSNRKG